MHLHHTVNTSQPHPGHNPSTPQLPTPTHQFPITQCTSTILSICYSFTYLPTVPHTCLPTAYNPVHPHLSGLRFNAPLPKHLGRLQPSAPGAPYNLMPPCHIKPHQAYPPSLSVARCSWRVSTTAPHACPQLLASTHQLPTTQCTPT